MTSLQIAKVRPSRRVAYLAGLAAVLALAPLLYNLPLIGLGLEDLNMVRHFADEESHFVEFHGQYQRGPLHAPVYHNLDIYPKAFYNLAGIFLYPYSAINGGDFQVVLTAWRVLSMLMGVGAVVMLFLLARRVFRSNAVAFLGALLFAITPEFFIWTSAVRPNPLEQLLIFATLYFCIRLFQGFSYRTFLIAAFLAALTFSSKWGGWIFVLLLPALSVYLIWRGREARERWVTVVSGQIVLFLRAVPYLALMVAILGGVLGWLLFTHSWDSSALILDISERSFPPDKLEKAPQYLATWHWLTQLLAFGALAASIIAVVALAIAWRAGRWWYRLASSRAGFPVSLFLLAWLVIQVAAIYVLVYFAASPVYLARPEYFVSQFGHMFHYTVLGGSSGPDGAAPGLVESYRILSSQFHPVWIVFAFLLAYAVFREFRRRNEPDARRGQRLFLWLFCAVSIAMVLATRQPLARHLLPAIAVLYLFIADALITRLRTVDWSKARKAVLSGAAAMVVLVGILVGFHVNVAYGNWQFKHSKPEDTGLQVGAWLVERYPEDTRILTDWEPFYVPPAFAQTSTVTQVDRAERQPDRKLQAVRDIIVEFDPDVVVITHSQGYEGFVNVLPLLSSDPVLSNRGYSLVKDFDYEKAARQRFKYERVLVYEKGGLLAGSRPLESTVR